LIILDKLVCFLFSPHGGALLFHFLIKLYECRDFVITAHISFGEWAQVLGDTTMTTAMLCQLTHRCHILDTNNDSYCFQNRSETATKTTNKAATLSKAQPTVHT
jgi:DNA replication protein DnaC